MEGFRRRVQGSGSRVQSQALFNAEVLAWIEGVTEGLGFTLGRSIKMGKGSQDLLGVTAVPLWEFQTTRLPYLGGPSMKDPAVYSSSPGRETQTLY